MSGKERRKDMLIMISGYLIAAGSLWSIGKIAIIPQWVSKFGFYSGLFTFLIYMLRLKLAAENIDPDSREAFKEYLKLGSCYSFVLFIIELPMMLAVM